MNYMPTWILSINAGSSSVKFGIFNIAEINISQIYAGEITNLKTANGKFKINHILNHQSEEKLIHSSSLTHAAHTIIDFINDKQIPITIIGHRLVHGIDVNDPQYITTELIDELRMHSSYNPEHLPNQIELIEAFGNHFPGVPQFACFDSSFHNEMPLVAKWIPIPRKYFNQGIRRYGFHGLSYNYLMHELLRLTNKEVANSKIIIAHLGNGSSLTALKEGKSIDTSMSFTPNAGVCMSTRCGDIDPGVAFYLMRNEKFSPQKFNHVLNHESGLLGVSEISSDIRVLLDHEKSDTRAAEAIDLFCYSIKKMIGSYAAALGGLDQLIFSGGIGVHSPQIRLRICENLQFLGIELNTERNNENNAIISEDGARVEVRVMNTNEELMMAKLIVQHESIKAELQ
jgi:acetate kinase